MARTLRILCFTIVGGICAYADGTRSTVCVDSYGEYQKCDPSIVPFLIVYLPIFALIGFLYSLINKSSARIVFIITFLVIGNITVAVFASKIFLENSVFHSFRQAFKNSLESPGYGDVYALDFMFHVFPASLITFLVFEFISVVIQQRTET